MAAGLTDGCISAPDVSARSALHQHLWFHFVNLQRDIDPGDKVKTDIEV